EWFSSGDAGGGGTAVQTAAPVEVATKPRKPRARKKVEAPSEEPPKDAPPPEVPTETAPEKPSITAPAPTIEPAPPIERSGEAGAEKNEDELDASQHAPGI